jgi:hypothetical protein
MKTKAIETKAIALLDSRIVYSETSFAELVIWQLPGSAPGSRHLYKYRLAFVVDGECVIRYDNEAGKGDHRHVGARERSYQFVDVDKLLADFQRDIRRHTK